MQQFRGVEYDHKPNDVEIWKSGVDVTLSAVETEKQDEQTGETRIVWICDIDRYTLQEYIYFQQSNYEEALRIANEANATANKAKEIAQTGNEYTEAGKILLGEEV
ncbi:MAG: hypothetical protein IJE78_10580 [Bacteroidaceae bacterium]|nr:hypothetical protein [Bacteroidaceae bacterium]